MNGIISKIGKPLVQGLLALGGFGVLSWKYAIGDVPTETFVPLVALMVGFFFNAASQTSQAVNLEQLKQALRDVLKEIKPQ